MRIARFIVPKRGAERLRGEGQAQGCFGPLGMRTGLLEEPKRTPRIAISLRQRQTDLSVDNTLALRLKRLATQRALQDHHQALLTQASS